MFIFLFSRYFFSIFKVFQKTLSTRSAQRNLLTRNICTSPIKVAIIAKCEVISVFALMKMRWVYWSCSWTLFISLTRDQQSNFIHFSEHSLWWIFKRFRQFKRINEFERHVSAIIFSKHFPPAVDGTRFYLSCKTPLSPHTFFVGKMWVAFQKLR